MVLKTVHGERGAVKPCQRANAAQVKHRAVPLLARSLAVRIIRLPLQPQVVGRVQKLTVSNLSSNNIGTTISSLPMYTYLYIESRPITMSYRPRQPQRCALRPHIKLPRAQHSRATGDDPMVTHIGPLLGLPTESCNREFEEDRETGLRGYLVAANPIPTTQARLR